MNHEGSVSDQKEPGSWARLAFSQTEESMASTLAATFDELAELADKLKTQGYSRIVLTGEGCSHTAEMMCEMAFRRWSVLDTQVTLTSELDLLRETLTKKTCVVVLSRTGERRFILQAIDELRGRCGRVIAVTGNPDGAIRQFADETILTQEGPEPAFLKSKSTLSGLVVLLGLAACLAKPGSEGVLEERKAALVALTRLVGQGFPHNGNLADLNGTRAAEVKHWAVAAGGPSYGAAADGALKLHEITTVHASAYHLSDLYHGALGQLNQDWGAVVLATAGTRTWSEVLARQLVERGVHPVVYLDSTGETEAPAGVTQLSVPATQLTSQDLDAETVEMLSPPVFLPFLYSLIHDAALARGIDPDQPPNMDYMLDLILPAGQEEPDFARR